MKHDEREGIIANRNTKLLELRETIQNFRSQIETHKTAQRTAEEEDNSEAYSAASIQINMYQDRITKKEEEYNALVNSPVIPEQNYAIIADFISYDSARAYEEERTAIREHLDAIIAIFAEYDQYYRELHDFARYCEGANKAEYNGPFKYISVSSLSPAYKTPFDQANYLFKR